MSLKKRTRLISWDQEFSQLTFEQGLDMVVSTKRSEGLRISTLINYEKHFRYFTNKDFGFRDHVAVSLMLDSVLRNSELQV